jgi:hypothetical protein
MSPAPSVSDTDMFFFGLPFVKETTAVIGVAASELRARS